MNSTVERTLKFLNDEYMIQNENFERILNTTCIELINKRKLFRCKFLKIYDKYQLLIKFNASGYIPRKNSLHQYIIFLDERSRKKGVLDNKTYNDLLLLKKLHATGSLIWTRKDNDDPHYLLAGYSLSEVNSNFLNAVHSFQNTIIYIGECPPPTEMLQNLYAYTQSHPLNKFFFEDNQNCEFSVCPLGQEAANCKNILEILHTNSSIILQGPPGTGKSYLIADIAKELLIKNKSVLITTLANKALLEIIKKPSLKNALEENKVFKKALSSEDITSCPKLQELDVISPVKGQIHFSTYYSSTFAELLKNSQNIPYDYVIVDEASQALLPYLAATVSLGRKQIFVGDINQLPPVVELDDESIKRRNYISVIYGLLTVTKILPTYQLTLTYRLSPYAASCTQLFYKYDLISQNKEINFSITISKNEYNLSSGTYLVTTQNTMTESLLILVSELSEQFNKYVVNSAIRQKARVAIVTNRVQDVNNIDKYLRLQSDISDTRFTIDTVHRCQGFTADFAIFYIPDASFFSFRRELFNVATSRATIATFIICPGSIVDSSKGSDAGKYISKVINDSHEIRTKY